MSAALHAHRATAGEAIVADIRALYPLPRSLTGPGVRETLTWIGRRLPLMVHEVATGTPLFDWEVPDEWHLRRARIERLDGEVLVDSDRLNLHVVGYSVPFSGVITRESLAAHVHTLPAQPRLTPYRTAYFARTWGFCLPDDLWRTMTDTHYRVVVDTDLKPGSLSYGECVVAGTTDRELLFSAHVCHPSLANDNLSAIAVLVALGERLLARPARHTVRLVFAPATLGALAWLSHNEQGLKRIAGGLVLSCLGDEAPFHFKQSRDGNTLMDQVAADVLAGARPTARILPFSPTGYDERQYGSPGINLPVGALTRSPAGGYAAYHTSADTPDFLSPGALEGSLDMLEAIVRRFDDEPVYIRRDGRGEPQLGRRGLYRLIGGEATAATGEALLWALNLADGRHTLSGMARRSGLAEAALSDALALAVDAGLVERLCAWELS